MHPNNKQNQGNHDEAIGEVYSLTARPGFAAQAVCGVVLALCGAPFAHAQGTFRDLSGNVTDGHQEPLRGAVVYLENEATHAVLTYITDRSGSFSFKRLHGDVDYEVWAVFRGQNSKHRTLSQFDSHTAPALALVIKSE